jgi:hypothetical protein
MKKFAFALGLLVVVIAGRAEIPPAEKILPADTLVVFSLPDYGRPQTNRPATAQMQFWRDPAMKPFREKFMGKFQSELVGPLERELGVGLTNFTALARGQFTLAVVPNGWLALLDTGTNASLLATNLATLKHKWTDAGKPLKTEKLHGADFTILVLVSNDFTATLNNLAGAAPAPVVPDAGPDATPEPKPAAAAPAELYVGQKDSLLIAGTSSRAIEKVLSAMTGGDAPTLGEQPGFEADRLALFRDADFYLWANTKVLFDLLNKSVAPGDPDQGNSGSSMLPIRRDKVIPATGLAELRTLGYSAHPAGAGKSAQLLLAVPETARTGLLSVLAGEARETSPPSFVPAEVVSYTRWRLNGPKTWNALEKALNEVSPQLLGGLNFALMTAGAAAKEKDPDYDLKQVLVSNLGDDIISYQKAPRSQALADLAAPPSIFLISSPQPEKLLNAAKNLFAILNRRGDPPSEREFLGRKIYSIGLGAAQLANGDKTGPRALNLASANGYVAISMDSATLEEFLRSGEKPGKPLREVAGFAAAGQQVGGDGTSYFSYENQRETMRTTFALYKQFGNGGGGGPAPSLLDLVMTLAGPGELASVGSPAGLLGMVTGVKYFKGWADVSLLPDYDQVAKYFNFTVSAGSATPEGLALKVYAPTASDLKK